MRSSEAPDAINAIATERRRDSGRMAAKGGCCCRWNMTERTHSGVICVQDESGRYWLAFALAVHMVVTALGGKDNEEWGESNVPVIAGLYMHVYTASINRAQCNA